MSATLALIGRFLGHELTENPDEHILRVLFADHTGAVSKRYGVRQDLAANPFHLGGIVGPSGGYVSADTSRYRDTKEQREGDKVAVTSGLLGLRGVVENAIEIEARPEAVFDYCTDVLREPEWNPKLLEVEKLTAGPIGLGTRCRIRLDGVGWSTTEKIGFQRPSFCAATSASRLLDVA